MVGTDPIQNAPLTMPIAPHGITLRAYKGWAQQAASPPSALACPHLT